MKRRRVLLTGLTMIAFLVFTACSTRTAPTMAPAETSLSSVSQKPAPLVSVKETWEEEWDKVVREAKKEEKVVIYSTLPGTQTRDEITKAMKNKYGIELDILAGRGAELAEKLLSQRRAGVYIVDVYLGGPTTALVQLKPGGALGSLEPNLILPEVVDTKYWFGGKLPWIDKDRTLIGFFGSPNVPIAINTKIVKPEEIRSYRDLLNPKWKGKIIINDPTTAGTAASSFHILGWYILDLDFFHQLAKQEPVVVRDRRLMHDWLAHGKYGILLFPYSNIVKEFTDAGAPLSLITPQEGTYFGSGGGDIAIIRQTPHPDASKVFINWALSKEGQTIISKANGYQSLRTDVSTEGLDPFAIRQEGVKYFLDANTEEKALEGFEKNKIAQEIFGSFLR